MKKILFGMIAVISVSLILNCDVDGIKEALDKLDTILEKETGYLLLLNLPEDARAVSVVKVADIGVCNDINAISITGTSALVPIVDLRGGRFDKTGVYSISLLIETSGAELLVTGEAGLFAEFVDGEGTADLSGISAGETEEIEVEIEYNLIILNLPERTDADSFKTLRIGDYIAQCADFDTIKMDGTTAYIPLVNQRGEEFGLSGAFYIGLNVEVDSLNIVDVPYREHYIVHFASGKGIFDIDNPGEQMVIGATLKVINLPENTDTDSFTLLGVGGIARCARFDDILIKPDAHEAQIPLVVNDGKEFDKSGTYYIEMRLIVDSLSSVEITAADYLMVEFTNGYGVLDMVNVYNNMQPGYLNGHLTNEGNYYEPRVASGTMFELLGNYFRVVDDETIKTTSLLQSMADGIVYVYAVPNEKFVINAGILHYTDSDYADFRYMKNEPVYNAERKGWYNGNNRALWKFLKLGNEYRFKVRVDEDFPFDHAVTNTVTGTLRHSFTGDIYPTEITLESGFYIFEIAGASGGGGGVFDGMETGYRNYSDGSYSDFSYADWTATSGASGGKIIELINVKRTRKFWVYTGTGGKDGRMYGDGGWGDLDTLAIIGGGGGSGSYISDSVGASKGYFLSAGGGGGGYVKFDISFSWYYEIDAGINSRSYYVASDTVRAYISGGGGGIGGGGGAGGWIGSYAHDNTGGIMHPSQNTGETGCGGGIWGGIPYHEPDGNGIIGTVGKETILKNTTRSHTMALSDGEGGYYEYTKGVHYFYFFSDAGAGVSLFPVTTTNFGGLGGYITESGAAYSPTAGGNNRNSVRGGNSGDGYVKVYKLQ